MTWTQSFRHLNPTKRDLILFQIVFRKIEVVSHGTWWQKEKVCKNIFVKFLGILLHIQTETILDGSL